MRKDGEKGDLGQEGPGQRHIVTITVFVCVCVHVARDCSVSGTL